MATEVSEREKLEGLAAYLDVAREGLATDWGVSQGALTEFFNRMPGFLEQSQLSEANRNRLVAIVELANDSRDRLVHGMVGCTWDLKKTADFYHLYERLDFLREGLRNYIAAWYKEEGRAS